MMINQIHQTISQTLSKTPLKKLKNSSTNSQKTNNKYKTGWSQDVCPLLEVKDGICCMKDGTYVKILEVEASEYKQNKFSEKLSIASSFATMFTSAPVTVRIKVATENISLSPIVKNLQRAKYITEDEEWFLRRKNDHIESLNRMISQNSYQTRYYIIFKYEDKSTSNWDYIFSSIYKTCDMFFNVLQDCNCNIKINDNENDFNMDFLYRFFNPRSSLTEDYESRFDRIVDDFNLYNRTHKNTKYVTEVDVISSRGLYFDNVDYWQMDGMYFTHLLIHGDSIPNELTTGWLDSFITNGIDIDLFIKKKPTNLVQMELEAAHRTKLMFTPEKKQAGGNDSENIESYNDNIRYIRKALDNKQEYFEFMILITIKSPLLSQMYNLKDNIITKFKKQPYCLIFEEVYKDARTYFNMYMPFMNFENKFFAKHKRGCITETLMGLFPFTFSRTFDTTGFVLGINEESGDITAINNFDNKHYSNANISILGTSGAGKTYFMCMLGSHMLFSGLRTFYLCPVKGHELTFHIKSVGGTVIDFIPGSFDCYNIFEIRPETNFDAHELQEASSIIRGSLLAKKITEIVTFTQLALGNKEFLTSAERNKLNIVLTDMYADFEITSDNDSIYLNKSKKILKKMPTFSDAYNAISREPSLQKVLEAYSPFIYGTFKNFNGPTNVSLQNSAILVNVDESHIGKDMFPCIAYLGFIMLYNLVKESRLYFDAVFLDELWKMLINDLVGEQVFELIKIIRGYAGSVITATQDINDMLDNKWGRAIISNSSIKILKRLEGGENSECSKVCATLGISDEKYKNRIPKLSVEEALIITPQRKILTLLKSTELEDICFVTDSKGLRRRMEYMQKHQLSL